MVRIFLTFVFLILYYSETALAQFSFQNQDEIDQNINKFRTHAKFLMLNKTTSISTILDLPINQNEKFENLILKIKTCWTNTEIAKEESKSLIKVWEQKDEESKIIFNGWFFSNSPSASVLQHSVYDITLIKCY